MNYFVCIILLLIVGNFNSDCFNPDDIKSDLHNFANNGEIFSIKNDMFKLDRNGYLGQGNFGVVWKGIKHYSIIFLK